MLYFVLYTLFSYFIVLWGLHQNQDKNDKDYTLTKLIFKNI